VSEKLNTVLPIINYQLPFTNYLQLLHKNRGRFRVTAGVTNAIFALGFGLIKGAVSAEN
jgi:hypothetical protein